jgi:hypothetical protein
MSMFTHTRGLLMNVLIMIAREFQSAYVAWTTAPNQGFRPCVTGEGSI